MFSFDPETGRIHGVAPCPACGAPVHVVASPDERARWCCLACKTLGAAPFPYEPAALPAQVEERPQPPS